MSCVCLQQFSLDINFTYNEIYQSFFPVMKWGTSEVQLVNNVLISTLHQSDYVIHIYVYIYIECVCIYIYIYVRVCVCFNIYPVMKLLGHVLFHF